MISTNGNPDGHLVLRGGADGPNYSPEHIAASVAKMEKRNIRPKIVVDCSHANSNKDHTRQPNVLRAKFSSSSKAAKRPFAVSCWKVNIAAGNQKFPADSQ